jgi:hypothetical protein
MVNCGVTLRNLRRNVLVDFLKEGNEIVEAGW